jgi:hypothetical protein
LCHFMKERSHLNVKFVITLVLKRVTWIYILHEGKKPFACNICDYRCLSKSNLKQHIEYVHADKKQFKCDICNYKCKISSQCNICETSCSSNGDLKKHFVLVHEGNKPFKCEICDYRYSTKSFLNRHDVKVHEGKKPFWCPLKASMKVHVALIQEGKMRYHFDWSKKKKR